MPANATSPEFRAVPWQIPSTGLLTLGTANCVPQPAGEHVRNAFAFHRQNGAKASHALAMARVDAEKGRTRYPRRFSNMNPPNDAGARFVESPEEYGMRLEGTSQDLGQVDHSGWWMDREVQEETAQGVVYRLPSRSGRELFAYGVKTSYDDSGFLWTGTAIARDGARDHPNSGPGGMRLSVGSRVEIANEDAKRDAANWADSEAQSYAERECDYQDEWRAGQDLAHKAREMRDVASEWVADARAVREFFAMRHAGRKVARTGEPPEVPAGHFREYRARREVLSRLVKAARASCGDMREARDKFHRALRHAPARNSDSPYWDGFASGA